MSTKLITGKQKFLESQKLLTQEERESCRDLVNGVRTELVIRKLPRKKNSRPGDFHQMMVQVLGSALLTLLRTLSSHSRLPGFKS